MTDAVVTLISRYYQSSFLDALCGGGRKRGRERKNTGGDTIRKYAGSPCYLRYTVITACPPVLRVLNVSISPRRSSHRDRQRLIYIGMKARVNNCGIRML